MEEGDITQTGNTAFAPFPAPTYRYVLSSKADKLSISLEDRKSKKQWCTGYMDEDKYLTGTNRLLNATAADYVSIFQGALDFMMAVDVSVSCCDSGDDSSYSSEDEDDEECKREGADQDTSMVDPEKLRRQLISLGNDVLQLQLSVKVRVHESAWSAKYVFRLDPVSLERTDILEAKIQDLEEELATTKRTMMEEMDKKLKCVTAKSIQPVGIGDEGQILWTSVENAARKENRHEIKTGTAGWYTVTVKVHMQLQVGSCDMELRVNGECVQSDHVSGSTYGICSASLMLNIYLQSDDKLTVVASKNSTNVEASLTAAKIGI